MCRGAHRRQVEAWRHTRWLAWELRNGLRAPGEPGQTMHQILALPGDELPPSSVPETPEEVDALWAALDERDNALLAN